MSALEPTAALFARQHGVARDRQLRALGVSLRLQQSLIRNGLWRRVHPGVVADAGAPPSWHQRAMAATLAVPGSLLAAGAAARLHRCDGFTAYAALELIAPRSADAGILADVAVVRSRRLSGNDRHVIDAIPVTTLPVTLVHLSGNGLDAAKALDGALRDGFHPRWLRDGFERWQSPGVSGPSEVLRLLGERVDKRLPRSWFQRIARDVFAAEGLVLEDEWPLYDASGRHLADLDLAAVEERVGVECQSWEWHGSPAAQYRDVLRQRRITALGWTVIEVWWNDLRRPDSVVAHLRRALADARRLGR